MDVFRSFISRSGQNIRGASPQTIQMLNGTEEFGEPVEPSTQSPPLEVAASLRDHSRQRPKPPQRAHSSTMNEIPRPRQEIHAHFGKMLALPLHSVRPVDLNDHRKPGYTGINPVTLKGETGLLPGSWGQGKELSSTMAFCREARERQHKPDTAALHLYELRMQYAQAILDGDTFEESSMEHSAPIFTIPSQAESLPQENPIIDDEEWVDISDDDVEDTADRKKEQNHKREDSGYSTGDTTETLENTRAIKRPMVLRRKKVRFDQEAVEKQQEEWRTSKVRRL